MSSPELEVLQTQVGEVQEEVKGLALAVSGLQTLEARVHAVEAQQRAQGARLEHIDRVVMSIQVAIQKLEKMFAGLETLRLTDAKKLDAIYETQVRMLDLLQPRVVVGG